MPYRVENIVRKGEIACYKQFLLFSQSFPQLYIFSVSKCGKKKKKALHAGANTLLYLVFYLNPFPNDEFETLPNSKCLQMTISNLMKMAESSPNG